MEKYEVVKCVRTKYSAIISDLDERGRRRWAAAEARSLGWGGVSAVAIATGISDRTIRNGLKELGKSKQLSPNRQRQSGGGCKISPSQELGKAVPYGVYDISHNEAGVT